jgi:hypothetical protein
MSRVTRMVGRLGFAAAVLGALAFGATQALATAVQGECSLCNYPEQEPCQTCCEELDWEFGTCFPSGNCICW